MKKSWKDYHRIFYIGNIIVTLGIVMRTVMKDSLGGLGIVFISIGLLFYINAMSQKYKNQRSQS